MSAALDHCEIYGIVLEFFEGDEDKAHLWFMAPNPGLGGISPDDMFVMGRSTKLLAWIRDQLDENKAP